MRNYLTILVMLAGFAMMGCEEDVVAVLNAEYPYSMYGVLNPLADTQFVRVFPVEGTLEPPEEIEKLDVRFTSIDRSTGEERLWRDSLIAISDGTIGHVFYSPFRVEWEHDYRVSITGVDGVETFSEVTVPPRTNLIISAPDTSTNRVLLPATIDGIAPRVFRSRLNIQVKYVIGFDPAGNPFFYFLNYVFPFDQEVQRTGNGWNLAVDVEDIYFEVAGEVMRDLRYQPSRGITLQLITFSTVIGNEEWDPPGGVFDPVVLIQPGAFSNVENGFGFVAAGYKLQRAWTLPVEVVEKTSFRPNI
jgi:hypothetical protein